MDKIHIINKAINGHQSSLRWLYDKYVDEMYSSAYRITNDKSSAEDIVQESFVKSFSKLNTLKNKHNYQGWLRRIVLNKSIAYVRSRKYFEDVLTIESAAEEEGEKIWYIDLSFDQIKKAIQRLPNGARTVFSLYALEGYKHREIAEMIKISESTSKTQLRYAKTLMRDLLTKMYANEI